MKNNAYTATIGISIVSSKCAILDNAIMDNVLGKPLIEPYSACRDCPDVLNIDDASAPVPR